MLRGIVRVCRRTPGTFAYVLSPLLTTLISVFMSTLVTARTHLTWHERIKKSVQSNATRRVVCETVKQYFVE